MREKLYKETDENDFLDFLKKAVPRDLVFRGVIVYLLTLLAAVLAVEHDEITFVAYFERAGKIAPLVNLVGTGILLLWVAHGPEWKQNGNKRGGGRVAALGGPSASC